MTDQAKKLPDLLPTPLATRVTLAIGAVVLAAYAVALVAQASNVL